jgi:hypothetical protein
MNRYLRVTLIVVSLVQLGFAVLFALQSPIAVQLWPLPNTTPLSILFIGSIFAAAAASTLWCVLSKEYGALAGVALDYLMILVPLSILSFQLAGEIPAMLPFGIISVAALLFGIYLFLQTRSIPIRDTRPMPTPVRFAFMFFIVALLIVGGGLVLKVPNILPWVITEAGSVVYGWMFLGAAAYFTYALLRPSWGNSAGQLVGFLAYDIVLIIPFINRLSSVPPEFQTNHIIYTAVVALSGLLAIYYLFINANTRILPANNRPNE